MTVQTLWTVFVEVVPNILVVKRGCFLFWVYNSMEMKVLLVLELA